MIIRNTQAAFVGTTLTSHNQAWIDLLVSTSRRRQGFNSSKHAIIKAGSEGKGLPGLTTDHFEPVALQKFEHPTTLHSSTGLERPPIKE